MGAHASKDKDHVSRWLVLSTLTLSLSLCEASLGKSLMSITLVSVSMSHQVNHQHHHHHHQHHQSSSSGLQSIQSKASLSSNKIPTIAQLVERRTVVVNRIPQVTGSNPVGRIVFLCIQASIAVFRIVGIVGHLGLDVHCGVVGNIQAFHVCAPGSIPGNGIFSQSSLWLKSSCSMHACLVTGLVVLSVGLGLASSSSHF